MINFYQRFNFDMVEDVVKITKAVYRVLDFLPENDPLKNKAKEKALAVLENSTVVFPRPSEAFGVGGSVPGHQKPASAQGSGGAKEKASAEALDNIEILLNYLAIGKHQGWISATNFLIFEKEYRQIKSRIPVPKGSMKKGLDILHGLPQEQAVVIDVPKEIDARARHTGVPSVEPGQLSQKAMARQDKILNMLGQREKAQVSDFIKELPDITKRTIRRDLDDLLKKGKVVRVGAWNQVFYQITK
ncbi:DeoR family transcriptional regulator [Candidatus Parcubacteria bacterium]|nr:DeoR family transcriptional regulator [Candidatus Parcubacteria bacterium]